MSKNPYRFYSLILKLIASAFGLCCAAYGLTISVFGVMLTWNPHWGWRVFGFYVMAVGLTYVIPNRRFSTDEQVHFYIGFALFNTLLLTALLSNHLYSVWDNLSERFSGIMMMVSLIPATLAAPASLVLHLIGARRRAA